MYQAIPRTYPNPKTKTIFQKLVLKQYRYTCQSLTMLVHTLEKLFQSSVSLTACLHGVRLSFSWPTYCLSYISGARFAKSKPS